VRSGVMGHLRRAPRSGDARPPLRRRGRVRASDTARGRLVDDARGDGERHRGADGTTPGARRRGRARGDGDRPSRPGVPGQGLERLLGDPVERARLGAAGRRQARASSWAAAAAATMEVLDRCAPAHDR
jgi:hypothetical protein